jgi:hypothetical protein
VSVQGVPCPERDRNEIEKTGIGGARLAALEKDARKTYENDVELPKSVWPRCRRLGSASRLFEVLSIRVQEHPPLRPDLSQHLFDCPYVTGTLFQKHLMDFTRIRT